MAADKAKHAIDRMTLTALTSSGILETVYKKILIAYGIKDSIHQKKDNKATILANFIAVLHLSMKTISNASQFNLNKDKHTFPKALFPKLTKMFKILTDGEGNSNLNPLQVLFKEDLAIQLRGVINKAQLSLEKEDFSLLASTLQDLITLTAKSAEEKVDYEESPLEKLRRIKSDYVYNQVSETEGSITSLEFKAAKEFKAIENFLSSLRGSLEDMEHMFNVVTTATSQSA